MQCFSPSELDCTLANKSGRWPGCEVFKCEGRDRTKSSISGQTAALRLTWRSGDDPAAISTSGCSGNAAGEICQEGKMVVFLDEATTSWTQSKPRNTWRRRRRKDIWQKEKHKHLVEEKNLGTPQKAPGQGRKTPVTEETERRRKRCAAFLTVWIALCGKIERERGRPGLENVKVNFIRKVLNCRKSTLQWPGSILAPDGDPVKRIRTGGAGKRPSPVVAPYPLPDWPCL